VEAEKEGSPGEVEYELQGVDAQGERLRPETCQKGGSLVVNYEGFSLLVTFYCMRNNPAPKNLSKRENLVIKNKVLSFPS
jgi:hypothetical protein